MPGPTAAGSTFLASTRTVVDALVSVGHSEAVLSGSTVAGSTIEIFPTIFMAALLPPHEYVGKRGEHTDDLWLKLIGAAPVDEVAAPRPVLAPYGTVIAAVEQSPWGDRHELRAAAISAIAADWFGGFPLAQVALQRASTSCIQPRAASSCLPVPFAIRSSWR